MKVLVSADTINALHREGKTVLDVSAQCTIITPEARDLARKLGVAINDQGIANKTIVDQSADQTMLEKHTVDHIKQTIEAKLPPGKHDPALLEQLVRKALQTLSPQTSKHGFSDPNYRRDVSSSGVVLVHGDSVQFGQFDGVPDKPIGLTDVIGAADKSSIGAGFMQWEQSSFQWTLTYDEIDVVLEGELHIHCDGNTYIGYPGDVFYIPKDTTIEFSTPNKVRFVYITYPADWSALQGSA